MNFIYFLQAIVLSIVSYLFSHLNACSCLHLWGVSLFSFFVFFFGGGGEGGRVVYLFAAFIFLCNVET